MSETAPLRPTSFHMRLHVDPADDNGKEIPLTTKSWRVQLLRLLQRAPQPVPILCEEPRSFPHFETDGRISESSWTSVATYSTDVTASCSTSFSSIISTTKKGANENYRNAAVSGDDSSSKSVIRRMTGESGDADGTASCSFPREGKERIEKCVNGSSVNRKDEEVEEKLSNRPSSPQENSNSKVLDNRKHQLQQEAESGSRNTLVLSIQGDSEYWEKFRYSKDYQSSLMIETICNEVFNLKPSPRYKSLIGLSESETVGENIGENKRKIESPPQLQIVECNDNDVKGIKVEILELDKESGRKEEKSILAVKPPDDEKGEKKEHGKEDNVENVLCYREQQRRQQRNDIIENNADNDENKMKLEQQVEEKEIRNSITSSVFTATTEGASEDERRRKEKMLLLDGFGQTFHGYLTKLETEKLVRTDGEYLIRQIWNEDGFILSFMFDGKIWNYRILCDVDLGVLGENDKNTLTNPPPNTASCTYSYYLEDRRKCYRSVEELVREGLTTLHLDENAGSYIDLLVELAQFQRNDNLLQTPPAVTPGSRKTSRAASFKMARLASSSSAFGSGGTCKRGGSNGVDGDNSSPITNGRISMEIALLIHYFEEEIFDALAKCQVCTNGIWGSSNKGLRCRDCSHTVHESCIDNVRSCKPDLTTLSPFSTDLTSLVKGSYRNNYTDESHCAPYLLRTCINEVEARGLTAEGIYRICGSVEEIEKLKNLFEKDKIHTSLSESFDIHSITGLIKFFLRQLPDPLITEDVFEEYAREREDSPDTPMIDAVQTLVRCLPPAHRLTLKYLLKHLERVAKEKASNKMNAFNLSSIFYPSVLGPANMSFGSLESGTKLLHFMITQIAQVFA